MRLALQIWLTPQVILMIAILIARHFTPEDSAR